MRLHEIDKSELIFESYKIAGISDAECRSIFLDWLLKLPNNIDQTAAVQKMLDTYAGSAPDHPMTSVLRNALQNTPKSGRRGGRAARHRD